MTRHVVVVHGGLGSPSSTALLARSLGEAVDAELTSRGERVELHHVELRRLAHQVTDAMLTGFAAGELAAVVEQVRTADALVAVSPTFSASVSGLFKSFFDILEPELLWGKPMVLGATGGSERHSLMIEFAMRPLFAYLGADPVRTAVFAATSDFGTLAETIAPRARRAAVEVADRLAIPTPRPTASEQEDSSAAEAEIEDFEAMMARMGLA